MDGITVKRAMDGIINVYKPRGMTSFDAVAIVRRNLKTRAVGHMGTLDPLAEGVLLIGVGKGTKLFDYFLKKQKSYIASFTFGYETDTLDSDGAVTNESDKIPTLAEIVSILPKFLGESDQIPPQYSAKSVNGKRAYDIARSGGSVELKPSKIEIYGIKCTGQSDERTFTVEIHCSAGTYIRSLGRDIALELGTLATMTSLLRTKCGAFTVDGAVQISDVCESSLLNLGDVIDLPKYYAEDDCYNKLTNGVRIYQEDAPKGKLLLYCQSELFGIAENSDGIKITTYLKNNSK